MPELPWLRLPFGETAAYISGVSWPRYCMRRNLHVRAFASSRTLEVALNIDVIYFNTRELLGCGFVVVELCAECILRLLNCRCHMIASYESELCCTTNTADSAATAIIVNILCLFCYSCHFR